MADNILNITMSQGSSFTRVFNIKTSTLDALDLTDYDARLQVRKSYGATSTIINCTLANGKLVKTNAALGVLTLLLAPADTTSIRFNEVDDETLEAVYDLEIQNNITGKVAKPARGTFTLIREVTR